MRTAFFVLATLGCLPAQDSRVPSMDEVKSLVDQEFAGAFALNASRQNQKISPAYVSGDFNGDGRPDLAVLVSIQTDRLRPHLAADPLWSIPGLAISKALGKGMGVRAAKDAQLSFADLSENFQSSIVLLIVHNFNQAPEPTPAARFALLDFCNNGEIAMTVSRKPLKTTPAGDSPTIAAPVVKKDTLRFLDRKGEGTAVYWDGSRYRWYPIE